MYVHVVSITYLDYFIYCSEKRVMYKKKIVNLRNFFFIQNIFYGQNHKCKTYDLDLMAILLSISLYEIPFASRLLSQNVFCYLANILGIIDTYNKSGV